MMSSQLRLILPIVTVIPLMYFIATYVTIFDKIPTEVGYEYYAEPPDHQIPFIPTDLKMPMNCLVNIGYVIVGFIWIDKSNKAKRNFQDLFRLYSLMSIVYGFVQFLRIFYQTHRFAILDQWCTTPFFSFIIVWLQSLLQNEQLTLNRVYSAMTISCFTYLLSLFHVYGFEIQLVAHITVILYYGVILQVKEGNKETLRLLVAAILCCTGFVVLKVFDIYFGTFPFLQRFSGHFWSKICDFIQIHYVLSFLDHFGSERRKKE